MKDENVTLLDIIFSHLKFYNNEIAISTMNLIQQISNEKFKISIYTNYSSNRIDKYLINECNKKDTNIYSKVFNRTWNRYKQK